MFPTSWKTFGIFFLWTLLALAVLAMLFPAILAKILGGKLFTWSKSPTPPPATSSNG